MKYFFFLLFLPVLAFPQSTFKKAEELFAQKKYDQAKPLLQENLKANPSDLKTLELLGDIAGKQKKWEEGVKYYGKLVELKPSVANYHYKLGGVNGMLAKESNKFKALSMIGDVKASFEKAIELDPKHIDVRWALIELYLQLPAIVGGSESKAQAYAGQLMKISPVDGHLANGHIHEYYKRYPKAEASYKKAIEVGGSKTTYQKLADLYKNKMKQPAKAAATMALYGEKNKN